MTRILLTLASLSLILMGAALTIGLLVGDLYDRPGPDTLHWATVHRLTGIVAALVVVLVESVIVTYFIGTSRWCKEVVETYGLDPAPVRESNRLKRRAFASSLVGMLTILGVIVLGAAADPATGRPNTQAWTNFHLAGAIGGTALIAWTYVVGWQYIGANHAIIQQIVAEVARIRRERGLEPAFSAEK
jgi:hypothetical protein